MKLTIKVALVISLFASVTFADDGDMGNGGFTGDMGNGGRTCTVNCPTGLMPAEGETNTTDQDESILTFIQEYLDSLFAL